MPPKPNPPPSRVGTPSPPRMQTPSTPQVTRRDPSLIAVATGSVPQTYRHNTHQNFYDPPTAEENSKLRHLLTYLYNRDERTFCGRTCISWICIISYSIMYLIFLCTYSMIFLYGSLHILRSSQNFANDLQLLTYSGQVIGLTATPTAENDFPLIWYRTGDSNDYEKYVKALDKLLLTNRIKRDLSAHLGPCGRSPYGYGDEPCIIIRINKQLTWIAKPLQIESPNMKDAPAQVQKWVEKDTNKFWLYCNGYHSYDKEHIGNIRYYPDPPGFDSKLFPLDQKSESPLVAVQLSNFTLGMSLAIECKVWYDNGAASVEFVLYVAPKSRSSRNNSSLRYHL